MLTCLLVLEDTLVRINTLTGVSANITVCDTKTGEEKTVETTPAALGAAFALAIGGDEIPGSAGLYDLAEPLMVALVSENEATPRVLRFIP